MDEARKRTSREHEKNPQEVTKEHEGSNEESKYETTKAQEGMNGRVSGPHTDTT